VNGIDVDRVDTRAHGFVYFGCGFARAVEDDLVWTKANAQRFGELASAIDFDIYASVSDRSEHGHVGIRFRRVTKFHAPRDRSGCPLQARDVRAYARLGEDEEGSVVLADEGERVRPADV
jgi:hypothetical protein